METLSRRAVEPTINLSEAMSEDQSRTVLIRETIMRLATDRGADKTICPSEVARHIAGKDETKWRLLMKPIRNEAIRLTEEGRVTIKRKGRSVDPHDFRGIYRIALLRGNER